MLCVHKQSGRFGRRSRVSDAALVSKITGLALLMLLGASQSAVGVDIKLAWDPVNDSRVAFYEVHWGSAANEYTSKSSTTGTSLTVAGLDEGKTYYFAARACESGGSSCSGFSNAVSNPIAAFSASPVQGAAPLAVGFSDQSTGQVASWSWDFGDGTAKSTEKSPQHSYAAPGVYTVSLLVTGPGGATHQTTKSGYVKVAPIADFSATTRTGLDSLMTTFSCKSQGEITSRVWNFGDGSDPVVGNSKQVGYEYKTPGTYTVSLSVAGPSGSDAEVKVGYIEVTASQPPPPTKPTADFAADKVKGPAPLTVSFQNLSGGQVDTSSWSFGDGSTSTAPDPSHEYTEPGLYTVSLTVSNAGGSDTVTRSAYVEVQDGDELPMEFGEITVNDQWKQVKFSRSYVDPIVVAKPLSANDSEPAVVRIDRTDGTGNIDTTGFKIRVQEWDYLTTAAQGNGVHPDETLSYVVMERGRHQLPDGAWVVAGRVQTNATNKFSSQKFVTPFGTVPVMLAAVTSVNEADAVAVRLRYITTTGFQVGMREQENKTQSHAAETIDYLAMEPSFGTVNGVRYEVDLMPNKVKEPNEAVPQTLIYRTAFSRAPLFMADMQTTAGSEPANLRWRNRDEVGVELWVAEEQSKDLEVKHASESVGYLVIEPAAASSDCATPCSLWDEATTPSVAATSEEAAQELGMRFRSEVAGQVTGVRFYKGSGNNGTHVGRLWSGSGQLLAEATFADESASGWQQVSFASPVPVQADTTYVVSYYAPNGHHAYDRDYFRTGYTKGPLHAPADGEAGSGNGVYCYGLGGCFPSWSYLSTNYWVDVVFQTK